MGNTYPKYYASTPSLYQMNTETTWNLRNQGRTDLHLMGLGLNRGNDQELNKKSSSQIALKWFTQEIHAKNPITISAQKLYSSREDSSCDK